MSHAHRRKGLVACAVAALLALSVTSSTVAGATGKRPRTHRIEYTMRTTLQAGAPLCDAAQHCLFPYTAPSIAWTGDFAGTGLETGGSMPGSPRGTFGSELRIFVGTLEPCGSGTLLMTSSGVTGSDARGTGSWRIVPGFGTDDLEGVTGSGTSTHDSTEDALSPITTAKGTVRC
jgi:Protein of unknown function (DUF3224)